jgi:GDPmannose 4,6-dehydratase
MKKTALITGITGQDGSFLAELLLEKGYKVFGLVRSDSHSKMTNISHLLDKIEILYGDLLNEVDVIRALQTAQPKEIYNLAAQSHPGESWLRASEALLINGLAALRLFDFVRHHCPESKICQASSSSMFGKPSVIIQNEQTPFNPLNPYAAAKLYAHNMARIYRESYQTYIACAILFNHESERRPLHFLSQKVAYGAACAALKIDNSPDVNEIGKPIVQNGKLALGNLDIARDWGYATDFVRAMWLILQQSKPEDFVIGTGQLHTLKELCEIAYAFAEVDWRDHVVSDPALIRPLESQQSVADPSKAQKQLHWSPVVSFQEMIQKMVLAQIERLKRIQSANYNI